MVKTKKTELLFLALFLRLLKVGGRAAVIVPDGVLFGSSKAHKELRRTLVEDHELDGIVKLPSGVFKPSAGVSTAILLFTKAGVGGTDDVWFHEVTADGWSPTPSPGGSTGTTPSGSASAPSRASACRARRSPLTATTSRWIAVRRSCTRTSSVAIGYGGAEKQVRRLGGSGDGGVDGVMDQDALGLDRVSVQAKGYAADNSVGRETIQAFVGALHGRHASLPGW